MLCVQRWLPYKTHIQASRHWRYPLEGLLWKWLSLSWQQQQNMMLLVVIISIFFSAAAAVANEDKWAETSEIRQRYQSDDANSSGGGSWKSLSHSHSLSSISSLSSEWAKNRRLSLSSRWAGLLSHQQTTTTTDSSLPDAEAVCSLLHTPHLISDDYFWWW